MVEDVAKLVKKCSELKFSSQEDLKITTKLIDYIEHNNISYSEIKKYFSQPVQNNLVNPVNQAKWRGLFSSKKSWDKELQLVLTFSLPLIFYANNKYDIYDIAEWDSARKVWVSEN